MSGAVAVPATHANAERGHTPEANAEGVGRAAVRSIYTHPIYGDVDVGDVATMVRLREAANVVRAVDASPRLTKLFTPGRLRALAHELLAQAETYDERPMCKVCAGRHKTSDCHMGEL